MRRSFSIRLSLLLSVLLFTGIAAAQSNFLPFSDNTRSAKESKPAVKTTDNGAESVEVSYSLAGANVSSKKEGADTYSMLSIDDFSMTMEVGKPALPSKNEMIAVPDGAEIDIVVTKTTFKEYKDYDIYPALAPERDTYGAKPSEFKKDKETYSSDAFYPAKLVDLVNTPVLRGSKMAVVRTCPVQYNPATRTLRVYSEISYKVLFKNSKDSGFNNFNKNTDSYNEGLQSIVINPSVIAKTAEPSLKEASAANERADYIILTHSSFSKAADSLALWKRQMGYTVRIVKSASWTSAQVKDSIRGLYMAWSPKPDYFVIIGDHEQVPGQILYDPADNEPFASDLYYACMDGGTDYMPHMAHGRISVTTESQALMVVQKMINYERNPITDASFYKTAVACAQFQDDDSDGYEDRRFALTSEEIRNYLQTNFSYNISRIYAAKSGVTPRYWNRGLYASGAALPSDLLISSGFSWNGSQTAIASKINAGTFFVLHRDHGYVGGSGWSMPYFTTTQVGSLSNGRKLPVVFSINCHTGEFRLAECFAEKFLRHANGGAVGVVAAAYYSYSGSNDAFAMGMFDAIWSSPGLTPSFTGSGGIKRPTVSAHGNIRTMGAVVNHGLLRMTKTWGGSLTSERYEYELFHYFGDPTMKMWTHLPSTIAATHTGTIHCANTTFKILTTTAVGGNATLYFNGEVIAQTKNLTGANDVLTFPAIYDVAPSARLVITGEDMRPLIIDIPVVGPCTSTPIPSFTANIKSICPGDTIAFTDKSRFTPTSWKWSFSPATVQFVNGSSASSQNPQVRFLSPGQYSVALFVSNMYGNKDTTIANFISINEPEANFTADKTDVPVGSAVRYTDMSSCGNNIISYKWNFGANAVPATATTAGPHTVTYQVGGAKTVQLIINNKDTVEKINAVNIIQPLSLPVKETFETSISGEGTNTSAGTLSNQWTRNTTGNFQWLVYSGSTPSASTGPTIDHTLGSSAGIYVYTEASSPSALGDTAWLMSPFVSLLSSASPSLSFWYHIYGTSVNKLIVELYNGTSWAVIHTITGSQQSSETDAWRIANINLTPYSGMAVKIRFKVVHGSTFEGDVALDDISIYQPTPMVFSSSTAVQASTELTFASAVNQQIIGVQVETKGGLNPLSATSLSFATTGSTSDADIARAKVYYTGTNPAFSTDLPYGASVNLPSGAFNVTGNQALSEGMNYFWLVYDIATNAAERHDVDAVCTALVVGGISRTPAVTAPAGSRQIQKVINVGTGTYTGIGLPAKLSSYYTYAQSIYKSTDLLIPAVIESISYYYGGTTASSNDVKVYLGHTTKTVFASTTDWLPLSDLTEVYSGSLNTPSAQGWVTIALPAPFIYNGTDNLVVAIDENTSNSTASTDMFYNTLSADNRSIVLYNDQINPDPAAPTTGVLKTYYPNVRFSYSTPLPMALSSITTVQPVTDSITIGHKNQQIIRIDINTTGAANPLQVTKLNLATTGTTDNADILNAKVYYTGGRPTFSTDKMFGSIALPAGSYSVLGSQNLLPGNNYFWVAYDVTTDTLKENNLVDAVCSSAIISAQNVTPAITSPAGARKLVKQVKSQWTWMLYMYEDGTGLSGADDINEWEANGSIPNVLNYIVLYDSDNDSKDGIYWVEKDPDGYNSSIISTKVSSIMGTDPNMNNWQTLQQFMIWSKDNYPARNYGLTVWDHGTGIFDNIFGLQNNTTDAAVGAMKLWEMQKAVKNFRIATGQKIEIVGFDVSLLGQIETAYQFKDDANYVIASERSKPSDGWDYVAPFSKLNANPNMSSAQLATHIVDDYVSSYQGGSQGTQSVTQAATSVKLLMDSLVPAINKLADTLIFYLPTQRIPILQALNNSWVADSYFDHKDLGDFVRYLSNDASLPAPLRACAQDAFRTLQVAVIRSGFTGYASGPTGLKTWMEENIATTGINYTYYTDTTNYLLYSKTRWDEFLLEINKPAPMSFTGVQITQNTASTNPGATNQQILKIVVSADGLIKPIAASSFELSTNGSTNNLDITNARLYSTGTVNAFSTASQFGSDVVSPSGNFTVSGSKTLSAGNNYFWLVYDIAANAAVSNVLDAECLSVTVGSETKSPTVTAPVGGRTITLEMMIGFTGVTSPSLPVDSYMGYTYSQSIYPASVMKGSKVITSIYYYWNGNNTWNDQIKIYMANTAKSVYSSSSDWVAASALTQVYSGTLSVSAVPGWVAVKLDSPFMYDGTKNLLIGVDENTSGYHSSSGDFYSYAVDANIRSIYYTNDSNNPDPTAPPTGTTTSYIPHLKLQYSLPVPMQFVSATVTQPNASLVQIGSTDQNILCVPVVTRGFLSPLDLTQLNFTTTGTTKPADVTKAKVYYTGNKKEFSTATQFGSTVIAPIGSFSVTGSTILQTDTNYFWLAYDITADTLSANNVVDATLASLSVGGVSITPTVSDPAGNRKLIYLNRSLVLPWIETFEDAGPKLSYTSAADQIEGIPLWRYEKTINGQLRFQAGSGFAFAGTKAASLDASITGTVSQNYITATLNIAKYKSATDLNLSFKYMLHGDETSANDAVWIRGNNTRAWIKVYSLTTVTTSATWRTVSNIDIDSALAKNGQECGETFQLRFGQEDDFTATGLAESDGITFDNIMVGGTMPLPMQLVSSTASMPDASPIILGSANQSILKLQVSTVGALNPLTVSTIHFNTIGTTDLRDIDSVRLYYTQTDAFSTARQIGSALFKPNGAFEMPVSKALATGNNYFWLMYDVSLSAKENDVIDASVDEVVFASATEIPANASPAGNRIIKANDAAPSNLKHTLDEDMGIVKLTWDYNPASGSAFADEQFDQASSQWQSTSGTWNVSGGSYNVATENLLSASYSNQDFSNFELEARMRKTNGSTYNIGLYFNGDPTHAESDLEWLNTYKFVYTTDGKWKFIKNIDGSCNVLQEYISSSAIITSLNSWNVLKVVCQDGYIDLYINSVKVGSYFDQTFMRGKVGVAVYDGTNAGSAEIDYVKVSPISRAYEFAPITEPVAIKVYDSPVDQNYSNDQVPIRIEKSVMPEFVPANGATKNTEGFKVFNVYRDSVLIGSTAAKNFIDTMPAYGNYYYNVSVQYDELESAYAGKENVSWIEFNLPWVEDFEDAAQTLPYSQNTTSLIGLPEWKYEKTVNGRLRFNAGTGFYHGGAKAATLDATSSLSVNYLTATLKLNKYQLSDDVSLSFYYMNHGEEQSANDMVWIRGNSAATWIPIYNLYTNQASAGTWKFVKPIDIDSVLSKNSQVMTNTFQIRFGQEDDYDATSLSSSDGYTFDDIVVTGSVPSPMAIVGTNAVQATTAKVLTGGLNQEILRVNVAAKGVLLPQTLQAISFTTNGTTKPSDIVSAHLFYTAKDSTFTNPVEVGTACALPNGQFAFTLNRNLLAGNSYFWLAYDVSVTAIEGNVLDATCTNITISGAQYNPATSAPIGNRVISSELIIGTGTVSGKLPINPYYAYSYSQSIFKKAQLGSTKLITQISYYWNGYESWSDDIQVYLGNTTRSAFASSADWTPMTEMTKVYDGKLTVPAAAGWVTIPLSTPFLYNGVGNLEVAVDENTSGYHSSSGDFQCTTPDALMNSIYYYSDGTNPNPASPPSGTLLSTVPNIRLGYISQRPMILSDIVVSQATTDEILASSVENRILKVCVETSGVIGNLILDSLRFTTNGTTSIQSLASAKIYTTRSESTFTNPVKVGTTIVKPNGAFAFKASSNLGIGKNYFWLVFDLSATAIGEIDATCEKLKISGNWIVPSITNPVGFRKTPNIITIGTGTTKQALPIDNNYEYTYSQSIYTKAQLGSKKIITEIFYYWNGYEAWTDAVDVYFAHVSKSSFSSTSDWVPYNSLTKVFSSTLSVPAKAGWVSIPLSTPFLYNGIDNLVIAVDENTSGYHTPFGFFYNTAATPNASMYYSSDISNPLPASPGLGIRLSSIPNLKFNYLDNDVHSVESVMQSQQNSIVAPGLSDHNVNRTNVNVSGTEGTLNMSSVIYNTSGTTRTADIINAKLYSTGNSLDLASKVLVGSTSINSSNKLVFSTNINLLTGTNNLWVIIDINGQAADNDIISITCENIIVNQSSTLAALPNPSGNTKIKVNDVSICSGDSVLLDGKYVKTSGMYQNTLLTSLGADSIITVRLSVIPTISQTKTITVCHGESYLGHTVSEIFTDTLTAKSGCDSIVTTYLTVRPAITAAESVVICNGQTYKGHSVSEEFTETLTAQTGCDSLVTTSLTVRPAIATTESVTICNGETYKGHSVSEMFTETLTALSGCDSLVTTTLTVRPAIAASESVTICNGETYKGHSVSEVFTETLTALSGCDSLVTTSLTVRPAIVTTESVTICNGETYKGHSVSEVFTETLTTGSGCDSLVITNLTVLKTYSVTEQKSICAGEAYKGFSQSGTYTVSEKTVLGCDSIVSLALVVNPLPVIKDSTVVNIKSNETKSVSPESHFALYKWSDGTSLDSASVDGSKLGIGEHALSLVVTDENGCNASGTYYIHVTNSVAVQIIDSITVNLYPNPINDKLTIECSGSIEDIMASIINENGQIVGEYCLKSECQGIKKEVDVSSLPASTYHIQISIGNSSKLFTVIKK